MANIKDFSHTFEDGTIAVNATLHPINFQDSVTGQTVVIPSSVSPDEKSGEFVINAQTNQVDLGNGFVTTEYGPTPEGEHAIEKIGDLAKENDLDLDKIRIVGSVIAAQAYGPKTDESGEVDYSKCVVGMVFVNSEEGRADKIMASDKFVVFPAKEDIANDKMNEMEARIQSLESENNDLKAEINELKKETGDNVSNEQSDDSSGIISDKTLEDDKQSDSELVKGLKELGFDVKQEYIVQVAEIDCHDGNMILVEDLGEDRYQLTLIDENGEVVYDENGEMVEIAYSLDDIVARVDDLGYEVGKDGIEAKDNDSSYAIENSGSEWKD